MRTLPRMLTNPPPVGLSHSRLKVFMRRRRRWTQLFLATPTWLTGKQKRAMKKLYNLARKLREAGMQVDVDHIVPLQSRYVCGLHVPWNLRLMGKLENMRKGNFDWPGSPWENEDLIGAYQPQQLELKL